MLIKRVWAMPSAWTFNIKPIKQLLYKHVGSGMLIDGLWCDPFAGKNSPAQETNDINSKRPSKYHMDALEFLKMWPDDHFDGVLFDPPYSITQAKEHYEGHGIDQLTIKPTSMDYWSGCKDEIKRIVKPDGKAICFGWNSMGLGKKRGFVMVEVLLVPHGGSKNDTIVTVEEKA